MSGWTLKRFWKEAAVAQTDGGYEVLLDGRKVMTPAKAPLTVPSRRLAEAIAAEWDLQEGEIDPTRMPLTRTANSAIDKVRPQRIEVAKLLAAYGGHDLLCYRAPKPEALVRRQADAWDPVLAWAGRALGAPLNVGHGVMHVDQAPESLATLAKLVDRFDDFGMAAFHDLVSISGSLILGLAVTSRHLDAETAWAAARVDETWQIETWGEDDLFAEAESHKKQAFLKAAEFWDLLGAMPAS